MRDEELGQGSGVMGNWGIGELGKSLISRYIITKTGEKLEISN